MKRNQDIDAKLNLIHFECFKGIEEILKRQLMEEQKRQEFEPAAIIAMQLAALSDSTAGQIAGVIEAYRRVGIEPPTTVEAMTEMFIKQLRSDIDDAVKEFSHQTMQ